MERASAPSAVIGDSVPSGQPPSGGSAASAVTPTTSGPMASSGATSARDSGPDPLKEPANSWSASSPANQNTAAPASQRYPRADPPAWRDAPSHRLTAAAPEARRPTTFIFAPPGRTAARGSFRRRTQDYPPTERVLSRTHVYLRDPESPESGFLRINGCSSPDEGRATSQPIVALTLRTGGHASVEEGPTPGDIYG